MGEGGGEGHVDGGVNGHEPARGGKRRVEAVRDGLEEADGEGFGRHVGEGSRAQGTKGGHGSHGVAPVQHGCRRAERPHHPRALPGPAQLMAVVASGHFSLHYSLARSWFGKNT